MLNKLKTSKIDEKKIFIFLLVGYLMTQLLTPYFNKKNLVNESASVRSSQVRGTSLLYEYLQETGREVLINSINFSRSKILDKAQALALINSEYSLSFLEIEKVENFVKTGGHLILNLKGAEDLSKHYVLLKKFKIKLEVEENKSFKNKKLETLESEGLKGTFYGLYNFENCLVSKFHCYYYEKGLGKGKVTILLGISPFSNRLLQEEGNLDLLEYILGDAQVIGIDEYHHFFGAKDIYDMLAEPRLFLTVLAIFMIVIIFFTFSYVPKRLLIKEKPELFNGNVHDLSLSLLQGSENDILNQDLIRKHRQYLANEYHVDPEVLKSLKTIKEITDFHQKKLSEKGYNYAN
ncbi:DUF4350 domain-containing protein [Bacteriovorax sp. DB6_IX]|uniref:DUF4350 domain-containing protein n=1 Tax=Bacteriovorax sp. DB6_IX TaxID=1353530 RepID=UPI000389EA4D|nr:DUF4350 domain-containing protein [Bacteriovorax sp. DB6_IX]EQC50665.1 hypothetical protein M901_2550 [Bacteriovorax sp. DB6_IX]